MNNPIKGVLEKAVQGAVEDAAGAAVSGAMAELDNDTVTLTVGPIVIPAITIPPFSVPVKIDTAKG